MSGRQGKARPAVRPAALAEIVGKGIRRALKMLGRREKRRSDGDLAGRKSGRRIGGGGTEYRVRILPSSH